MIALVRDLPLVPVAWGVLLVIVVGVVAHGLRAVGREAESSRRLRDAAQRYLGEDDDSDTDGGWR